MKILQINMCYITGSTGRTTLEFERFLNNQGIDNYVAYGFGRKDNNQKHFRVVNKMEYYNHNILASLTGKQGFFSRRPTARLIRWIDSVSPDVVHLRNLHGNCFYLPSLFLYLSSHPNIKVVWSTHDFWMISGSCTTLCCEKWKSSGGCSKCPCFKRDKHNWFFDQSRFLFIQKKNMLGSIKKLGIQCVSKYCLEQINQSFLKDRKANVIYNWIDITKFFPRKVEKKTRPVVLVVWSVIRLESQRFRDFERVANRLHSLYDFLCVGKASFNHKTSPNISFIGNVSSYEKLAYFYSLADVFFDPSTEDTFGKVVAEALACGTPAVVYKSKALPELIGENCGVVVEPHNIDEACQAIQNIICLGKQKYTDSCVSFVKQTFDYYVNCAKIVSFYEDL